MRNRECNSVMNASLNGLCAMFMRMRMYANAYALIYSMEIIHVHEIAHYSITKSVGLKSKANENYSVTQLSLPKCKL